MKYFFGLFLLLLSVGAHAQIDDTLFLKGIKSLDDGAFLYHQKKFVSDVERPFEADGVFQLVRDKGVILKQKNPEPWVFVSTPTRYCFDDKAGDLADLPYFSYIKKAVDDLLSGQDEALYQIGDVAYMEKDGLWFVDITPTQKRVAQFVRKITLRGKEKISFWKIEYTDGTRIEMDFVPIKQDFSNEIDC